MGWKIFAHAVGLVFGHLGPALRISGLLYFVPALALQVSAATAVAAGNSEREVATSPVTLLFILVTAVAALWIAVAWHRYVLMDEMPGSVLPPFNGGRILGYFGRSLLLGLILLGIWIVVFIPIGLVAAGAAAIQRTDVGTALVGIVGLFVGYFVIAIISYRLSPILPASSIDRPIGLGDAWASTRGASGAILGLSFITVLCVIGLEFVASGVLSVALWPGIVLSVAVSWVELIVGVSIITTLYGVYVEKRPIG